MQRLIVSFLLVPVFLMATCLQAEGFYKWTDARGVVHYGEKAPKNQRAEALEMPEITVLEDYGKKWLPLEVDKPAKKSANKASSSVKKIAVSPNFKPNYETLKFIAPKAGQVINAKDGDVSAMLSIKPHLKNGHKIVFILDGKEKPKAKSRISNFTNLGAGTHTLSAKIINKSGDMQMSSDELSFKLNR